MAVWIHCNKCGAKPTGTVNFFVTNCGHIFCEDCARTLVGTGAVCPYCSNPRTRSIPISPSTLMPEIKRVFESVASKLDKLLRKYKFQARQYKYLVTSLRSKVDCLEQQLAEKNLAVKTLEAQNEQLKTILIQHQQQQQLGGSGTFDNYHRRAGSQPRTPNSFSHLTEDFRHRFESRFPAAASTPAAQTRKTPTAASGDCGYGSL